LNASGRSCGGFSTKIHVLTEAHGLPIEVYLTPGQTADIFAVSGVSALLAGTEQRPREVLADKGHDSDELRCELCLQGSHSIIARTSNRKKPGALDKARYAKRTRTERMMGFATSFRHVATWTCPGLVPVT
jgi:transposase